MKTYCVLKKEDHRKESYRFLCSGDVIEYWSGRLDLIHSFKPIIYTSKLKAKIRACCVSGVAVELKFGEIPEQPYLFSYEPKTSWVMDTFNGVIEKSDSRLLIYLDKGRYKLLNGVIKVRWNKWNIAITRR